MKKGVNPLTWFAAVMTIFMIGLGGFGAYMYFGSTSASVVDADGNVVATDGSQIVVDTRSGVAATAYLNAYDTEANSQTEIYPAYWIFDSNGNKLVNGVNANSTSTVKGETLSVYIGGATYYGSPSLNEFKVTNEGPTFSIDGATIATETNLKVYGYDSDKNALTADDNATNTADYAYDVGADAKKILYFKIVNEQANSLYRVGMVCTFSSTNTTTTDDFEVVDSNWNEVSIPKELTKNAISIADDNGAAGTQTGFDRCYEPTSGYVDLNEWDELEVKTLVDVAGSAPSANGRSNIGLLFIDKAWEDGEDGKVYFDTFKHDENEQVTAVGLSDTITSPQGLTSGAVVELI